MSALEDCPLVIFIAYTVPPDAEARGYSQWLVDVDMPFFNAIPGTGHYANWRISKRLLGDETAWDYFDFQGLAREDDLERVWFNHDLDGFRKNWLSLWGYGGGEAPPVLRHAYLMRRVGPATPRLDRELTLTGGLGTVPEGTGDVRWQVEGVLHKHFGGAGDGDWLTPPKAFNPLGLDWIAIDYGKENALSSSAKLACTANLIAAPDR
ncbi:hypothetical protein [Albibacillus kandeliae]|uniref:hypothetical protein n=1 Tax=Albibacillus kandeliae TaxID=2174228 RepID=UPI000D6923FD|nr:hypothetical protein [Albibacillus kandeliae]